MEAITILQKVVELVVGAEEDLALTRLKFCVISTQWDILRAQGLITLIQLCNRMKLLKVKVDSLNALKVEVVFLESRKQASRSV